MPTANLDIVTDSASSIMLTTDGSNVSYPSQQWSMTGDSYHFEVADVDNSQVPFAIDTGCPSYIILKSDGKIGFSTSTPDYMMELQTTGVNAEFASDRTDGATCYISGGLYRGFFGTKTAHPLRIAVNDSWKMQISGLSGDNLLDMSDGGYYDGTWHDSSSREVKENIKSLSQNTLNNRSVNLVFAQ